MVDDRERAEVVDVRWHEHAVSRADRERTAGHSGCVLWFTGLSGCGKSTLANAVDRRRYGKEVAARFGLGFGPADRAENIRRIGAVAELFAQAGIVTLTAFISPYRRDRDAVRAMLAPGDFVEVFVKAPLDVCESRDPKGLYKKARAGEIKNFTGIDDPYEEPLKPELVVDSTAAPPDELADRVLRWLADAGKIPRA